MEQIIETQEEMWHDVKEDMESARQAGVTLLDCIHPKQRDVHEEWYTPDIKANAAELKQVLIQLEDMKNKFDRFWKEHKSKIQYGLKVCLFEREMSQVCAFFIITILHLHDLSNFSQTPDPVIQEVHVLAKLIVLCSWARHLTLTLPLFTHVDLWPDCIV